MQRCNWARPWIQGIQGLVNSSPPLTPRIVVYQPCFHDQRNSYRAGGCAWIMDGGGIILLKQRHMFRNSIRLYRMFSHSLLSSP